MKINDIMASMMVREHGDVSSTAIIVIICN